MILRLKVTFVLGRLLQVKTLEYRIRRLNLNIEFPNTLVIPQVCSRGTLRMDFGVDRGDRLTNRFQRQTELFDLSLQLLNTFFGFLDFPLRSTLDVTKARLMSGEMNTAQYQDSRIDNLAHTLKLVNCYVERL